MRLLETSKLDHTVELFENRVLKAEILQKTHLQVVLHNVI